MENIDLKSILQNELTHRCKKNPRYSLRSFAKYLNVDAGNLSRAMRGQTQLSKKYVDRISKALCIDPVVKKTYKQNSVSHKNKKNFELVPDDVFEIISDPIHYAILDITSLEDFKSNIDWLSKRLKITKTQATLGVQRLLSTGLLCTNEKGQWCKSIKKIKTPPGQSTSKAHRKHQFQVLTRGADAIENIPIEKRCHISMTLPTDPQKIEIARKLIENFSEKLCERMSTLDKKEIYQLGICFYPVSN